MDVAFKRSPLGSEGERFRLRTGFLRAFGIAVLFVARFQRYRDFRREKDAHERFLQDLALLAAATAHEMGTPLSTMTFVVDDLRRCDAPPPDWKESMDVLWQQIQACKSSLSGLAEAARPSAAGRGTSQRGGRCAYSRD